MPDNIVRGVFEPRLIEKPSELEAVDHAREMIRNHTDFLCQHLMLEEVALYLFMLAWQLSRRAKDKSVRD